MAQLKPGARTCRYCTQPDGTPAGLGLLTGPYSLSGSRKGGTQMPEGEYLVKVWHCPDCGYMELQSREPSP